MPWGECVLVGLCIQEGILPGPLIAANGAHSVPSGPPAVAEWLESYTAGAS